MTGRGGGVRGGGGGGLKCREVASKGPFDENGSQHMLRLGGGWGGCGQRCTLHAVVVLCVCLWTLAKFGESFHAYTRFIRWGGSNSTIY